jgi:ureidoacrylate peracid hydrolase
MYAGKDSVSKLSYRTDRIPAIDSFEMADITPPIVNTGGNEQRSVTMTARPESLHLDPQETAVIVIDMQNAYASKGGYVDLSSLSGDVTDLIPTISKIGTVLSTARSASIPVIFLQNGWDPEYVEAGTPLSPNWHKSNALKTMRAKPELNGKLLARGSWDYELVDALKPQPGDICVNKTRYSAFFNSQLDSVLRARRIKNLVFVGIATNVCVESTLRDGFHLEYFCTMLENAVSPIGGQAMQDATVFNVEKFFGWVSSSEDFCEAFGM